MTEKETLRQASMRILGINTPTWILEGSEKLAEEYAQLHTAELEEERNAFVARYISTNKKRADMEAENKALKNEILNMINVSEVLFQKINRAKQALEGLSESSVRAYTRSEVEELMDDAFHVGYNVGENDETSPSFLTAEEYIKNRLEGWGNDTKD